VSVCQQADLAVRDVSLKGTSTKNMCNYDPRGTPIKLGSDPIVPR